MLHCGLLLHPLWPLGDQTSTARGFSRRLSGTTHTLHPEDDEEGSQQSSDPEHPSTMAHPLTAEMSEPMLGSSVCLFLKSESYLPLGACREDETHIPGAEEALDTLQVSFGSEFVSEKKGV